MQPPVRIRLNPATRLLWRGVDSVQLELGRQAVVLEGVDATTIRHLVAPAVPVDAPDGAPDDSADLMRADPRLDALIDALGRRGFAWAEPESRRPPESRIPPRLGAELAALRIRHGRRARDLLAARSQARVVINGGGRAAPLLAAIVGAAGVGHVHVAGSGKVRLGSLVPAGPGIGDEGRDYEQVCAEAVTRAAPEARTTAPTSLEPADLVVLTADGPVDESARRLLHEDAQAHLVVQSSGDHLSVGPLVLPGLTSCLHCADLHRLDRDPAWSALAVQLANPAKYPPASDIALVSLAASVAAVHVIAFLDGDEPASVNGTIELEQPDWRLRRRSWPPRPDCDCQPGRVPVTG